MAKRGRPSRPDIAHRLPVVLAEEDILFLQRLGYDCVREPSDDTYEARPRPAARGRKLPMSSIVRALIHVVRGLKLDLAGCRDEADLEARLVRALRAKYGAPEA